MASLIIQNTYTRIKIDMDYLCIAVNVVNNYDGLKFSYILSLWFISRKFNTCTKFATSND